MRSRNDNSLGVRPSRARVFGILFGLLLVVPQVAHGAELYPGVRVPRGYEVAGKRAVSRGVTHYRLVKDGSAPQVVRLARVAKGSPYVLRPVISHGLVTGTSTLFERTSTMCRRHDCIVGINGDFFYGDGLPAGALVSQGEPILYPPRYSRPHLLRARDGSMRVGKLALSTSMTVRYPIVTEARPATPLDGPLNSHTVRDTDEVGSLAIDKINVPDRGKRLVLYTPRFGRRTKTGGGRTEMILRLPTRIKVGQPIDVRVVGLRKAGNSLIPKDGAVLSSRYGGGETLRRVWDDLQSGRARPDLQLRIDTGGVWNATAGNPVILRDRQILDAGRSSFARARHPRTIVGWTSAGDLLLVTVDGRSPGRASGMSLRQASILMKRLGAVDAVNLDGGGSTTFVERGRVRNKPSDRLVLRDGHVRKVSASRPGDVVLRYVERKVAVALLVVPA